MAMRNGHRAIQLILLPVLLALACTRSGRVAPNATVPTQQTSAAEPQAAGTEPSGPFAAPEEPSGATNPGLALQAFEYNGLERSYRLIAPTGYDPDLPAPLVLALHGGGGNSLQMCTLAGGIQELTETEGFLVVCPDAIENHWNDGRGNQRYRSQAEDIDDVGYLLALIERLSSEYAIDPERFYVTGASNGGMMTQRLACEAASSFAAAAVVIASLPTALKCQPDRAIPILFINGTDDPLMPYQGGQVHFYQRELGEVLSTPETIEFWATADGCASAPQTELLPDRDPNDGTRVRTTRYSDCTSDSEVVLYSIEGGGHTWPGGAQYAPPFVIGRVSRELAANDVIWDFFEAMER